MAKTLTRSQIEQIAVNKIENVCLQFNRLQPLIKDADKIPCIDGQIIVRNKPTEKKEDIIGYITVQVKGTQVNKFSRLETTFSVDIADIKNYKLHDGVVFFRC